MQRRNFIYQSLCLGGMATISKSLVFASSSNDTIYSPFVLPPLPFAVNALEPHIDKQTMEIHHGKHHAGYVKNLNKELEGNTDLQGMSIEKICETISKFSVAVRNNAGGHYNHSLFWKLLSTNGGKASTKLNEAIIKDFGSMEAMQTQFNEAAKTRFGSGWAWLIYSNGKLKICSTPNQDNPLMDIADSKGYPLITVDVWEHAYYLKYQNRRPDYISAFWNVLNWKEVSERFKIATK